MSKAVLYLAITAVIVQVNTSLVLGQGRGGGGAQGSTMASASPLDYEVFKTKVQPILTSPRKGNARCMA